MVRSSGVRVLGVVLLSAALAACSGSGGANGGGSPAGAGGASPSPGGPAVSPGGGGGGGALGSSVAPGGDLCGLLGPGDFAAIGVTGAGAPTGNNNPPTDYYCVYAGKSSSTGGIEFDAFVAPTTDDAKAIFETVLNETALLIRTNRGADVGADQAVLAVNIKGENGDVAIIAVREGALVFDIGFPSGPNAESQLIALAKLVLARAVAQTQ